MWLARTDEVELQDSPARISAVLDGVMKGELESVEEGEGQIRASRAWVKEIIVKSNQEEYQIL